jgi:hypothetical protein
VYSINGKMVIKVTNIMGRYPAMVIAAIFSIEMNLGSGIFLPFNF